MVTRQRIIVCVLVGLSVVAVAAALHPQEAKPGEEGWIALFNGNDLSGWHIRNAGAENSWTVVDGVMKNAAHGVDLVTDQKFTDMELHFEFKVPPGSNSGLYLQGRYEIQILDSAEGPPRNNGCGGIYKLITPSVNAAKPAGEWQSFDVKFWSAKLDDAGNKVKKARITVVHNGKLIIDNAEIEKPTGGQLDNNEGTPGPVMVQGNHGAIECRNIKWRPLEQVAAREGTSEGT